ncbi:MAG: hypothetical protein E6R12_12570 [Sphingomonadales bacterium]|nr:MAG: hypothetical protein E6R12_12570 [Sphingomonadales bacterium]
MSCRTLHLTQVPDLLLSALQLLAARVMATPPNEVIGRNGQPYLQRWYVARQRNAAIDNVYIHRFTSSDPGEDMHDHPWSSHGVVLRGWYGEHWIDDAGERHFDVRWPGEVIARRADTRHAISSCQPGTVTLFMTGPKIRDWGFVTPDGWVHHQQYHQEHAA